jgi:hypothetical protein
MDSKKDLFEKLYYGLAGVRPALPNAGTRLNRTRRGDETWDELYLAELSLCESFEEFINPPMPYGSVEGAMAVNRLWLKHRLDSLMGRDEYK